MSNTFRLLLDKDNGTGFLYLLGDPSKSFCKIPSERIQREADAGYILSSPNQGFCRFDVTTVVGDMMEDKNEIFAFIDSTLSVPERYAAVQQALRNYFVREDFSVKHISDILGKLGASFGQNGKDGMIEYSCATLAQVAFSIIYFLIVNQYKFANCEHCGRLYATQTLKIKYCNRYSTYSEYERYHCKDAVKQIKDSLEKRQRTVDARLRARAKEYGYHSKYGDMLRAFQDKCTAYRATIKEKASVENLAGYSDFLQNGDGLPKKYERTKEVRK